MDATGLSIQRHEGRWNLTPYAQRCTGSDWLKLHALIDAESQTILSWRLTEPRVADTREFANLIRQVHAPIHELYADAGYLSRANCFEARAAGATPYIRPKIDTRIAQPHHTAFNDMVRRYQRNPKRWLRRYHRRHRVESTFAALKRRLGGKLRSLADHMLRIEACLKILVWNLTRFKFTEF